MENEVVVVFTWAAISAAALALYIVGVFKGWVKPEHFDDFPHH